jgi:NAD(P)-dependent dehydrogenase (short-subunit alcohol dehydrogenase family)
MQIKGSIALVTGANRGIGRALTQALIQAGAAKVYATARDPRQLEGLVAEAQGKVVALPLDVTDPAQIARAAAASGDTTLVFNNAGVWVSGSVLESTRAQLEEDLAINFFGALNVARAFVPVLERANKAGIVNILSVVSLAAVPALGGYSVSKAAASSMTQALRAELAARNIDVYGVYPGPIDTDMVRAVDGPKTSPAVTAQAIVAGVNAGQLDIFPDPMAQTVHGLWSKDPAELVRQFAAMEITRG